MFISCYFTFFSPSGLEMGFKVVLHVKQVLANQTGKFVSPIPSSLLQSPQQKGLLMAHKLAKLSPETISVITSTTQKSHKLPN